MVRTVLDSAVLCCAACPFCYVVHRTRGPVRPLRLTLQLSYHLTTHRSSLTSSSPFFTFTSPYSDSTSASASALLLLFSPNHQSTDRPTARPPAAPLPLFNIPPLRSSSVVLFVLRLRLGNDLLFAVSVLLFRDFVSSVRRPRPSDRCVRARCCIRAVSVSFCASSR